MAVLGGFLPQSQALPAASPGLTVALDGFSGIVGWPPGESELSSKLIVPLATHWPVEANGRSVSGFAGQAFSDDYYHRIHISPDLLSLGNVVSAQSSSVFVWNAYLISQTLNTISGLGDGIEVAGQDSPPLLFKPLKERVWELTVTPNGQPVVDTEVVWAFDGGLVAGIRVTANRIIPWSFVPDWGDGVIERLTAATDILQSESAASQRRRLRLAPRREFEAPVYAEGRERQLLDLALHGWGARIWALPIWPDIQLLQVHVEADASFISCSTEYLDFRVGGLAMLRGESAFEYEAVEIEAVTALGLQLKRATQQSWPAGTRLYPVRAAQLLEQPSLTKLTDGLYSADVQFLVVEVCEWPETMPATAYRGRPVWTARPDDSEDLTHSFERLRTTLDNGMAIPRFSDSANRALTVLGQRWVDQGRAQRSAIRSFIYAMAGRQKVVWVPTHMRDLSLVAPVSAVATTLDVDNVGYTRFGGARPGRRDLQIELTDGTILMRRVIGSTEVSSQIERLGLDSALGVDVALHQVARISWMVLCRFDSDTQEIHHLTDSEGVATWSTVFREERDDEL
jgi:hypothetical protein